MKFLDPQSALRFGTTFLAFVPFVTRVAATDDAFFRDDGIFPIASFTVANGARYCKTIKDIVCSTRGLDTFCSALDQTGLDGKLDRDDSELTVFVPSDSAFEKLLDDLDVDNFDDYPTLKDLVEVHIHEDGIVDGDDLEDRCGELLLMLNGEETRTKCENYGPKLFQKGSGNSNDETPRIVAYDIEACNGVMHIVNRVILPSLSPTHKPTPHPAHGPTHNPTRKPTPHPEHDPTRYPTKEPTRHPTHDPTRYPTKEPTRHPTHDPTRYPTKKPTPHPEAKPTRYPTRSPTRHPEARPTRKPTRSPTRHPEARPTRKPTRSPTRHPDANPTRRPTPNPTRKVDNGSDNASCSAHPECVKAGLTGDNCCPGFGYLNLDCCAEETPTRRPTSKPTDRNNNSEDSCSAYPKCVELKLEGDCCPGNGEKMLDCCFDDTPIRRPTPKPTDRDNNTEGSCSAYPKCKELKLTGECCPTNDGKKLDCCYDEIPGTCSRYPGCAAKGLEGECCPAANGKNLECCGEQENGLPIINPVNPEYCRYEPDCSCYNVGLPECCLTSSIACPKEQPRCEVGFPIIGESYCTYAPNYGCYESGWPKCCDDHPSECPEYQPDCEISPVIEYAYCSRQPDYQCYEFGHPNCCFDKDSDACPYERPECNVGKRGCNRNDSLPSIHNFLCSRESNTNFDILCYLIEKADADELLGLDDKGTYTLFAPTNEAFEGLGEDAVIDLLDNPTGKLKEILKNHLSDSIYFQKNLYCDRKIFTLSNGDFTTTKCNARGLFQQGNGNERGAYPFIVATDIVTCNGVVHVVDKVILPKE